ncbi:VGR-like protein [Acinetobacter haemolyticus]|nr:VGR-like protein [Acinetobacter haemolyticus]
MKAGQHVFESGATVNAELPSLPKSGMYSMRFDLSQVFDNSIFKNMKYKLMNHTKKIESEYEFEKESSARIYSDSADQVELALVPGAYLKPLNEAKNNKVAESLDELEEVLLHKDLKCKAPLIEPNLRRNLGKWST